MLTLPGTFQQKNDISTWQQWSDSLSRSPHRPVTRDVGITAAPGKTVSCIVIWKLGNDPKTIQPTTSPQRAVYLPAVPDEEHTAPGRQQLKFSIHSICFHHLLHPELAVTGVHWSHSKLWGQFDKWVRELHFIYLFFLQKKLYFTSTLTKYNLVV